MLLGRTAAWELASTKLHELVGQAAALGDHSLEAKVLHSLADLHAQRRHLSTALTHLRRAALVAEAGDDDAVRVAILLDMIGVEANYGEGIPKARQLYASAKAITDRLQRPPIITERLAMAHIKLLLAEGTVDQAERELAALTPSWRA